MTPDPPDAATPPDDYSDLEGWIYLEEIEEDDFVDGLTIAFTIREEEEYWP